MNFNDYQKAARKTAIYPETARVLYSTLGLVGEAGEVANKVKKIFRDDDGDVTSKRKAAIASELGDVCWYLAALATDLGLNLGDIAQENLDILADRRERGVIQGSGDNR